MSVASILEHKGSEVFTVAPTTTVDKVVSFLAEKRIGAIVITDGTELLGIISERDIVQGLSEQGPKIMSFPVSALMTTNIVTCTRQEPIENIMARMTQGRFRHMPVMEGNRLIGIVSIGDVVKNRISDLEYETQAMRDYISGPLQ